MKTLNIGDFREQMSLFLDDLAAERILITKRGQPRAKIMPVPCCCADLTGNGRGLARIHKTICFRLLLGLHWLRRLPDGLDDENFTVAADQVHVWSIARNVRLNLGALDSDSDPEDEMIAATILTHDFPLLTRDYCL